MSDDEFELPSRQDINYVDGQGRQDTSSNDEQRRRDSSSSNHQRRRDSSDDDERRQDDSSSNEERVPHYEDYAPIRRVQEGESNDGDAYSVKWKNTTQQYYSRKRYTKPIFFFQGVP